MDVAGHLLKQAEINLDDFRGKILPYKLVLFLRKINPTWEDLMDEDLRKITFNQLFPDKFVDWTHDTPQLSPYTPQQIKLTFSFAVYDYIIKTTNSKINTF